jgi:hypothetical protein
VVPLAADEIAVTFAGGVLPYLVNRMLRPDQSPAAAGRTDDASGSPPLSVASST